MSKLNTASANRVLVFSMFMPSNKHELPIQ